MLPTPSQLQNVTRFLKARDDPIELVGRFRRDLEAAAANAVYFVVTIKCRIYVLLLNLIDQRP